MLFLDTWFWIFAAVAVPVYWLCPQRWKAIWLLAASLTFHWHFAGPAGMKPIILLAIMTYTAALAIAGGAPRTVFLGASSAVVGALVFYKYSDFGLSVLSRPLGAHVDWSMPVAPLAISFFTFEFVHYLYEVRVHGREPIRNPLHFALFTVFFPSLASGPIKRFPDFVPQLERLENPSREQVLAAVQRIIRGLFKKVCIADLAVELIDVFEHVPHATPSVVASLAVLQGFRIYYDFAGYTDMAVGLAQLFHLRIPENFDRPYFSTSLQEFWRRWHMSLSSWIRDYIYIPLGGNRAHRVANLLAAMVLCGLWHGAAWNFAAWGLFHGLGLALEALVRRARPAWFSASGPMAFARWAVCYGWVTYGWLLFFYPIGTVARMTTQALAWGLQ
jgi:alginate O-acetyltransferase complex protein AlgI